MFRNDLRGVDAYTRHKKLMRDFKNFYRSSSEVKPHETSHKTEYEILREHHRFIRDDDVEASWEQRVAKKYYDRLFKEYAICELKYYKQGKIALRWRTENEVISGKGQFVCASTRCDSTESLNSWEVNFGYVEEGIKKNELVKVRLCAECSDKLNYKTKKRLLSKTKKRAREEEEEHAVSKRPKSSKAASDEEQEEQSENEDEEQSRKEADDKASNIWSKPLEAKEEKTKEEEFEDYFADLLQ
ncbi:hypothetical protein EC973_002774 [Apophysomyces ossiformis]|uniref:Protein FRA10AC1 n=1 Tax=Apophysomyces ossiformis TaxID=679940 RepID=A0A8H7EV18_9FUNG|nr:hypothetical protein EC973_002774 [Apophysomyces ossiformis]